MNIADAPTVYLPVLPPQARPGTAPLRLRAILAECLRREQEPPMEPLSTAMEWLFMATMRCFHAHPGAAMPHTLVTALNDMQKAMHDGDARSRKNATIIAIAEVSKSAAIVDSEVRRALYVAQWYTRPAYSEVAR